MGEALITRRGSVFGLSDMTLKPLATTSVTYTGEVKTVPIKLPKKVYDYRAIMITISYNITTDEKHAGYGKVTMNLGGATSIGLDTFWMGSTSEAPCTSTGTTRQVFIPMVFDPSAYGTVSPLYVSIVWDGSTGNHVLASDVFNVASFESLNTDTLNMVLPDDNFISISSGSFTFEISGC